MGEQAYDAHRQAMYGEQPRALSALKDALATKDARIAEMERELAKANQDLDSKRIKCKELADRADAARAKLAEKDSTHRLFHESQAATTRAMKAEDRIRELERERDEARAESEGRRKRLLEVGEERTAEWKRAEAAEAEVARLREALEKCRDAARHDATRMLGVPGFAPSGAAEIEAIVNRALAQQHPQGQEAGDA